MQPLLSQLATDYPNITFTPARTFSWSPKKCEIRYNTAETGHKAGYALLHEVGHALLEHQHYTADFELVTMEVNAWETAKRLAKTYGVSIDEDHVQDCLDTYRDWLYRRSICPTCHTKALQQDDKPLYICHNCHASWQVSPSRFCRPYRQLR